jgi:NADH-quinone oxidoreductase subunit J
MITYALYIASALGACSLLLLMPRRGYNPALLGAPLGGVALGAMWLMLSQHMVQHPGISDPARGYYYIFSAIAIGSAARVITHTKPVYAALWFVMVVLSSAGLFLVLDAEFMAAALVIIYGGAILVTYVFVIMLAAEAGASEPGQESPEYERVAREPMVAVIAGHLLLAALLSVLFVPLERNPDAAAQPDAQVIARQLTDRPAAQMIERYAADGIAPPANLVADTQKLDNVERVGMDLFESHPLGLELAGVILLVSLVGAVVIARKRNDPETAEPSA